MRRCVISKSFLRRERYTGVFTTENLPTGRTSAEVDLDLFQPIHIFGFLSTLTIIVLNLNPL